MPAIPYTDKFSRKTIIPNTNGITSENDAIILVKAMGPIFNASKPAYMEMHRNTPYKSPKNNDGIWNDTPVTMPKIKNTITPDSALFILKTAAFPPFAAYPFPKADCPEEHTILRKYKRKTMYYLYLYLLF